MHTGGPSDDGIAVGRVARPHGVHGELAVVAVTDQPDRRYAPGRRLRAVGGGRAATLTVRAARWHRGRLLVSFAEVASRERAEELTGAYLEIAPEEAGPAGEESWWEHELAGLDVDDTDGRRIGRVRGVRHLPAQDLLEIATLDGREVLVPFVRAIVPEVDPAAGRVVVDPPGGLFPP